MSNRLASSKSPYLRQHQNNPVDWYPWGSEALERARQEDKPILLSVGYSACHWCHVMAHESFEDPEIAAQMNQHFINIKVDREEHPDVDQIYQQVTQLMTRSGGWPLTVFLTPELKPYYGGTYFPPEDRYGRPGFPRLLEALSRAYRDQRKDVEENAARLIEAMRDELPQKSSQTADLWKHDDFRMACENLLRFVDWEHGGVGGAPKFPNTSSLTYLWRSGNALDLKAARQAVLLTLVRMAEGGIYDQLGGGFHRYSVDEHWGVPHFEKMLYDNALLLKLYSEVLLSRDAGVSQDVRGLFIDVLSETVEYVLREMTAPQGAFFSAQDADSEGEEGMYFIWTPEELDRVLAPQESKVFQLRYGVSVEGNFEHASTVLRIARSLDEVANESSLTVAEVREHLAFACAKLREVRSEREIPGLDDKILISWNGLMISGLAWASRALDHAGKPALAHRASFAAHRAFDWIAKHAPDQTTGDLNSVLTSLGEARIPARLDDYAFLIQAGLDLLRFIPDESMSSRAAGIKSQVTHWSNRAWTLFSDPNSGGFFLSGPDHPELIQRPISMSDQAIPAGAAIFLESLLELEALGGQGAWGAELRPRLSGMRERVLKSPFAFSGLASAALKSWIGTVVLQGITSSKYQGHFAMTQELREGELQFCHEQTCERLTGGPAEVQRRLDLILAPRLQTSTE